MVLVRVSGFLAGPDRREQETELLVDTGSFYTVIPPKLAQHLGLRTMLTALLTADQRPVEAPLSAAHLRLLDREGGVPVVILEAPCLEKRIHRTGSSISSSSPFGWSNRFRASPMVMPEIPCHLFLIGVTIYIVWGEACMAWEHGGLFGGGGEGPRG